MPILTIEDQDRLATLAVLLMAGCTAAEARAWLAQYEKETTRWVN